MHNLGLTRSDRQPTHLLQTPDTFVGMPLPGFDGVSIIVHAAPAIGAAFTQYTAEFEPGRLARAGARAALSLCARRRHHRGSGRQDTRACRKRICPSTAQSAAHG